MHAAHTGLHGVTFTASCKIILKYVTADKVSTQTLFHASHAYFTDRLQVRLVNLN